MLLNLQILTGETKLKMFAGQFFELSNSIGSYREIFQVLSVRPSILFFIDDNVGESIINITVHHGG